MSDVTNLADRINAEFAAAEQTIKSFQTEQMAEHKARQERLRTLEQVFERLRGVWAPRLEVLKQKFGDTVDVAPKIAPASREVTFGFQSKLANVKLKFSASTDSDVRKVILNYDLQILPILQQFSPHAELEFPLGAVDDIAVGKWIDDQIVEFVQTYLALSRNEHYLKDHMVEDPIAKVRFPKFAAGATLELKGKTYYFIGEETRREFEKQSA